MSNADMGLDTSELGRVDVRPHIVQMLMTATLNAAEQTRATSAEMATAFIEIMMATAEQAARQGTLQDGTGIVDDLKRALTDARGRLVEAHRAEKQQKKNGFLDA